MKNYKKEFWKYLWYTDDTSTGEIKKIIQRKVRRLINRDAKKEIDNVRSQQQD